MYLSPILDCFDGGLPAWSIGTSPNAELANSSLEAACGTLREGQRPVTHSDRGCHYRWPGWIATCDENHLIRSMSKKGRNPDNSAMERFFDRLKNEFFHHQGLVGRDDIRVPPHARRLSEILQRGAAEGEAEMAEPDTALQKSGAGRIAKRQQRRLSALSKNDVNSDAS